jgi:hypothetical protein
LRETLQTGENIVNPEITILNAENEELPVSISTGVLKNKEDDFLGGVETFRDLSVMKKLTREASQKSSVVVSLKSCVNFLVNEPMLVFHGEMITTILRTI